MLVYDITDKESYEKMKKWVGELRNYLPESTPIAIAGNKLDLEKFRQIERDTALEYAEKINGAHFDTSAKTGKGIK